MRKRRNKEQLNGGQEPPLKSLAIEPKDYEEVPGEVVKGNDIEGNSSTLTNNDNNNPFLKKESANPLNGNVSSSGEDEKSVDFSSANSGIDITEKKQDNDQNRNLVPIKYTSQDNGPFVIYAKRERIKEVTLARDLKNCGITNIHNIYKMNESLLKIVFKDKTNANKTMDLKILKNYEFFIPEMFTTTYGVIRNIEIEIDVNELMDNIKAEVPIIKIERLKTFDSVNKVLKDTETVKIGFRASYLPRRVMLFDGLIKDVKFFLPRPMFCTECITYGHMKKKCRSRTKRCAICGEDTNSKDPHKCLGPNCRFCLNNHITNSRDCDEREVQIKIRNTMTIKKTSFREAKKYVAEKSNLPIEKNLTNFPNLSLNTARINNMNKLNDVIKNLKNRHDQLINLIDEIKQKLSNATQNHPGNDKILMDISLLMIQHEEQQN